MRIIGYLLTALLLMSCSAVNDDDKVTEQVAVGDRVPSFTVQVVDGDKTYPFSTDNLQGETVIVFFHTSCSDCQRDLPLLNRYYEQRRHEEGFQMVAISREESAESVAAYWAAHQLTIPYSAQTDRRIYQLFASSIIPRIYFCSAQGIVTRIDIEQFAI